MMAWPSKTNRFIIFRYNRVWIVGDNKKEDKYNTYDKKLLRTSQRKRIPDGIKLYYGSAYIIATLEFLKWMTTDSVALNFIDWSRDTFSPDEIIWATLSRIYQRKNITTNAQSNQLSGNPSTMLPPPTPSLGLTALSDSQLEASQLSYARTVKWESKALKWNSPYPVCQAMFSFYITYKYL